MKKIYGMFAMLLLVSAFATPMVFAENESIEDSEDILREEPILISPSPEEEKVPSAFRYGWEKFKLNFIRNQTVRAERELELARWKVAEARMAARNGNIERAEKAMAENEKLMERVQERVAKMDNRSLTPGLDNAIQVHEQRMAGLNVALQNANLSEEQRVRLEALISRMDNVSETLEQNKERIQEQRQEKLEELQTRVEEIQNRTQQRAIRN
jgi:DNA repair exonuclease SbcCD ATPase subunit